MFGDRLPARNKVSGKFLVTITCSERANKHFATDSDF